MLKVIIQRNKKKEPTGKIIVESKNEKTGTPYNFKYAAPNAVILTPGQLVDIMLSVKQQQAEINKVTRAYANGRVIKVEVTEFGEKVSVETKDAVDLASR